ncbi:hypothetical protein [Vibrio crassostreae]|uniref:hypothetical protein n=1 Tax=Vibrio crassostreae TaxID=246167 RepID=UPI00202202C0|nr:hypothetical protein [Vibrio crassostreae]
MSLKVALNLLEEYQALTGQEGQHMDDLKLELKCTFIQSKWLGEDDRQNLRHRALKYLQLEEDFCSLIDNYPANDLIMELKSLLLK